MFDTLQTFMKIAGDFKAPVDRDGSKMCVFFVAVSEWNLAELDVLPERRWRV